MIKVKGRSEFKHNGQHFKRDTVTGRILNGSPKPHKGVRDEGSRFARLDSRPSSTL